MQTISVECDPSWRTATSPCQQWRHCGRWTPTKVNDKHRWKTTREGEMHPARQNRLLSLLMANVWAPAERSAAAFTLTASGLCRCQTPESRRPGWVRTRSAAGRLLRSPAQRWPQRDAFLTFQLRWKEQTRVLSSQFRAGLTPEMSTLPELKSANRSGIWII